MNGQNKIRIAWGDESIRVNAEPPVYLLAAAIVSPNEPLEELAAIKPKNAKKLHWRDMTYHLQAQALEALARVEHSTTLVVGAPLSKKKQERGRRKCLETLLPALESMNVSILVLESRNDQKDKKDIELLLAMRRKGIISMIDIVHKSAKGEPRLWIPDQILGAYGDVLCDAKGSRYWTDSWKHIESHIKILRSTI